ncbi:MAG: hypothetical protein HQL15_10495 [Candidatus Omnitrophica bacterium]|nr:hypothetical protein [Candidatus Omnitrophota bacterium]
MKNKYILCCLIVLAFSAVVLAYSNHFHSSFHFDDSHTIENNLSIRSLKNIPLFFQSGSWFSSLPTHQSYRPILTALNAIEYSLGKGDPFYFHVFSFIFYLLLCVFYFFMLRIIFNRCRPSSDNSFVAFK